MLTLQKQNNDGGHNPYYLDIANQLRERILSGKFKAGQRFFSIRGLIKETQRSLPTVRSALNVLIKEGLLEARQGSGYYVTNRIESATNVNRGFFNFLAVIPSTSEPDEPWFTGKVGLGMIHRANLDHAVVSFYKRRTPGDNSSELVKFDLARITALRPDGIAWLHCRDEDAAILNELKKLRIPLVTTMRQAPGTDLPVIQEDNLIYASMVLSNFEARGHRRVGIIARSQEDDYFRGKLQAFREVAPSFKVQVRDDDIFYIPASDMRGDQQEQALATFLDERRDLTGFLVMAATGIRPLLSLYHSAMAERMKQLSLVLNVLDGVAVPDLPNGETLATIYPPLEKLGEQLVHYLIGAAGRRTDIPASRLISIFREGDSLKRI
jgi:DNA-binding transcriptional regulator YhcF (GntR family)/DNA-binding LacI/PurR family transcriptional regulator